MHPVRLAILDELRQDEQCVCHLEARLGLRQAYISQQLMALREAGLVADQRAGLNIFYRVTEPSVYAILDTAREITGSTETGPSESERPTNQTAACPCPKCSPESEGAAC